MDALTRFIVIPGVSLSIFSTVCFVLLLFFDDIDRLVKRYKRSVMFRAAVIGRVILYGLLGLLAAVVSSI